MLNWFGVLRIVPAMTHYTPSPPILLTPSKLTCFLQSFYPTLPPLYRSPFSCHCFTAPSFFLCYSSFTPPPVTSNPPSLLLPNSLTVKWLMVLQRTQPPLILLSGVPLSDRVCACNCVFVYCLINLTSSVRQKHAPKYCTFGCLLLFIQFSLLAIRWICNCCWSINAMCCPHYG